jgi:hypothetical protein
MMSFMGYKNFFIKYTSSRELFDCNTMDVNSCFLTMVTDLLNDPDPKTMAECK